MDPHLLRTFVAVAEHRSFSAAASALGYTQSAVSQQIAALEAELGVALLRRRPVEPTQAGERLLEHAGPLLLRLAAARADVTRAAAAPAARLTVAATALGAASAGLPAALMRLRAARPRAEVEVRLAGAPEVARLVAAGEAELGLADGLAAPTDPLPVAAATAGHLTARGVAHRDLAVALPREHPLAGAAGLALGDLVDALWIDAPALGAPLTRLREVAGADGFRPGLAYTGSDVATLAALVAAGHGLTLLPATAGTPWPYGPGTTGVRLTAPRLVHRVELLHATLPPGPAADLAAALAPAG
ncbi:hypothetical protein Misp01_20040 [Microtetraspora sp. NBRC 13810]|uniref:LysR family transcriptional regulator n=1 Tax=Microtetraspora sp. NBRC 13810 TaxID=3030990 RepID=UPI0024A26BDC|nr:LysR family transcriptional regulator [Microtetraspora sp. NBRC 13810]GLW06874.1 hypothetical protein Misp01_20040 [Microtetraspora sp. NBRC 13810]